MDQLRVRLHLREHPRQGSQQCVRVTEEAIMGSVLAGVLPQPFGRVQLRRVGW